MVVPPRRPMSSGIDPGSPAKRGSHTRSSGRLLGTNSIRSRGDGEVIGRKQKGYSVERRGLEPPDYVSYPRVRSFKWLSLSAGLSRSVSSALSGMPPTDWPSRRQREHIRVAGNSSQSDTHTTRAARNTISTHIVLCPRTLRVCSVVPAKRQAS